MTKTRTKKAIRVPRTTVLRSGRATADEAGVPPPLPTPNEAGLVNALQYVRASIANELVRLRRKAGLSQQKLAELAHVRQETISRIESARHTATPRVLNKLMRALSRAQPASRRRKVSA